MQTFIDRYGLDGFPQIVDDDGSIWLAFGAEIRSSFLFVNDDGTSETTGYGEADLELLDQQAERLIAS